MQPGLDCVRKAAEKARGSSQEAVSFPVFLWPKSCRIDGVESSCGLASIAEEPRARWRCQDPGEMTKGNGRFLGLLDKLWVVGSRAREASLPTPSLGQKTVSPDVRR